MSEENNASSGGVGLLGAVFLVFLVLKLVGGNPVEDWSWWWVTCPLWGATALVMIALVIGGTAFGAGACIAAISNSMGRGRRMRDVTDHE